MPKYIILIIVVLVTIGGYFITRQESTAPPKASEESVPEGQIPPEVREISVTATEFSFNPAIINIKAGEKVKIILKNEGRISHNFHFAIEDMLFGTETISGGQTTILEFTAPADSSTYAFFCSMPGHRALGMEGNLKVE